MQGETSVETNIALTAVYGVKLSPAHCASLLTETTRESNDSVTLDEFNTLSEK